MDEKPGVEKVKIHDFDVRILRNCIFSAVAVFFRLVPDAERPPVSQRRWAPNLLPYETRSPELAEPRSLLHGTSAGGRYGYDSRKRTFVQFFFRKAPIFFDFAMNPGYFNTEIVL
ncbi:MAG: hypothetical protein IJ943_05155 [Akkermansia sp.]|nr:hypothetical protein [Akkermansia sp.]